MTREVTPHRAARSLEELRERGLKDEAFREGYEQRAGMIRLGAMLKQLRESAGYTQEKLAALTGLTQPAISRLESGFGSHVPTIDTVMRYMHGCQYQLVIGAGHSPAQPPGRAPQIPGGVLAGTDAAVTTLDFQAVF
jgi:DNA-binding XRE family transcriptional regulator